MTDCKLEIFEIEAFRNWFFYKKSIPSRFVKMCYDLRLIHKNDDKRTVQFCTSSEIFKASSIHFLLSILFICYISKFQLFSYDIGWYDFIIMENDFRFDVNNGKITFQKYATEPEEKFRVKLNHVYENVQKPG